MATRMTPINTIISRLQRNVRQTCQTIGKKAELVVEGGDILVDGDVLNRLSDPFLHMLRNAVDHGIETPEERIQSGKAETGTIYLLFTRQGQSVVVRCYDDGRGLNYPAIREKAIHAGLIQADQEVAENELARLILLPGFSTKSKVTEVSGRGVGMDVVRDRILSMNGSIDIRSETGKGTTIDLRFQASLIVTHALLVRAGGQMYALPSFNIDQAIAPGSAEFTRVGDELNVVVGQAVYPAHALTALVGSRTSDLTEDNLRQKAVVIMRIEQNRVGIILDQLVESRDLIVKNMGKFVSRLKGVAGASILGDGTVAPVLDVPELLRTPVQTVFMTSEESTDAMSAARGAARVLIVDDSLTVRKTLEELIADNGYEARLARDGLEAIDIMRAFAPDVVLTDLEMPNMNGLELTSRLRANPQTQGLPIIMITSRSMDKHKDQARLAGVTVFLTKPYSDAELLQHIRSLIGKQLSAASGQN
jgi:chemosensory pili system protein ChpA (sensor histidine kinase/response regulator)